MYRIFLIEDDTKIRQELKTLLQKYGYECADSDDFAQIAKHALAANPDLILLDLNLPYFDGFEICRQLRRDSQVPIIIVTSRDSDLDELMSMNLGADDFITKPYHTQILTARIASVLRRAHPDGATSKLTHNGLTLNLSKGSAEFGETSCELTKNELKILNLLMSRKGEIITREEIMNELWQSDEFIDDNTLTVNINRLRKKLAEIGVTNYLKTKRGLGYQV